MKKSCVSTFYSILYNFDFVISKLKFQGAAVMQMSQDSHADGWSVTNQAKLNNLCQLPRTCFKNAFDKEISTKYIK